MPQRLETLLEHTRKLPKNQADLLLAFHDYKEENDAKVGHRRGLFVCLNLLARHLNGKSLEDATREDLQSFLKSKQKPIDEDPDQKWQTTWNSYHGTLTTFYSWVTNKDSDADPNDWEAPKIVTSIKKKKIKRKSPYKTGDVWLEHELLCVLKYCPSLRNKLIITLMWDLAGRNHEIIKLRINDIVFKEKYAIINIPWDTKTGERSNPAILSFPYLRDYINAHPFSAEPDAFLILSETSSKPLKPESLYTVMTTLRDKIKEMLNEGKILKDDVETITRLLRKPWNPYLVGRHSSITEKTDILLDHQLTSFAGWTPNTKRRATYSHRSGKQTRTPLLQHHGIEQKEEKKPSRKECHSCGHINVSEASICTKCNVVLNAAGFATVTKQEEDNTKRIEEQDAKIADQNKMIKEQGSQLVTIQNQLAAVLELLPAKQS